MTTINNDWITLTELRNGVRVQRKFAGLDTFINLDNSVQYCHVKYYERELYPDDEIIKAEQKYYSLEDLQYTEMVVDGVLKYMEPLAVLSGFINNLGYPGIINPARDTLSDTVILPLTCENGYPLRRDTRPKNQVL